MRGCAIALVLAAVGFIAGAASPGRAATAGPTPIVAPLAVGAPMVGQRLTALHGTWSGSVPPTFRYQWYRCDLSVAHCSSIHGATAPSYRLVAADAAHTIALTVGATDASGTAHAYASAVGPVAASTASFVSTVQPATTGVVKPGQTVRVDNGAWSKATDL